MFDDLVIHDRNNDECEKSSPDPKANVTGHTNSTPPIKKIHTTQAPPVLPVTGSVTQIMPSAVVLDFNLAKMYMLDCFLKDSILEKTYLCKIADMIDFAVNTQGLSVQNDKLKMAEIILAEIFY